MMCQAYNAYNEMIENDIDLFEDGGLKDPYFLCLRLLSLVKNKKKSKPKKGGHFKFFIEQDNEIIDQTPAIEDTFWVMKTHSISLNKQSLHFFVPDRNNSNTQFEMKMYRSSQYSVQEIANLQITVDTYIELFLEEGKKVFTETIALCPQYSLQYQIYIQKTKIQLDNLLLSDQNDSISGAFKKKAFEFMQIDHEKVEILKKDSIPNNSYALRKSLHFTHKKLLKPKDQRQIIIKSQKGNLGIHSFFSKIGTIITQFLSKESPLQKGETKTLYDSSIGTMELKKRNVFSQKKFLLAKIIITFVFILIIFYFMSTQAKKTRPTKWFRTSFF